MSLEFITNTAKILSDPTRVKILSLLREHGGMCVYEIAEQVGASQSATSHQLSKLEARGIVECYREGQRMCYELASTPKVEKLITILVGIV
jgi:DNA-binding transcriptional ArsR family regulator